MKKFIAVMLVVIMVLGTVPAFADEFFDDVPEDAYYVDPIVWAYDARVCRGYDDMHFYPNTACTRAHAVTFLYRYAQYKGYPVDVVDDASFIFTDVDSDDYYYDAVRWAQWNDIVNGVGGQRFAPNDICTRAQIVTMLYRMSEFYGITDTVLSGADCIFVDVPVSSYYFDAVCWAQWNEIALGCGNGKFLPNDACTRAQIVTMMYRFESSLY